MYKLLRFSFFFLLFTLSLFASKIQYAPVMMGDIITFVPYSNIVISIGKDRSLNQGEDNILTVNINYPNDVTSYKWKERNKLLGTDSTFSTKNLSSGIHHLTLTITDNNGLTVSKEISINIVANIYNGLLTLSDTIKKENIPTYLKALDIVEINKYVNPYIYVPYWTDVNQTIEYDSENGGYHTIEISQSTSSVMNIIHRFNNYSENNSIINGVINNKIYLSSSNNIQDVTVDNLSIVSSNSSMILEGSLTKSQNNRLLIQSFIVKNLTQNKTIFYENFIANIKSNFLTLYSGKVCNSIEGCINVNTTYDRTDIHSENIVLESKNNIATINKDYNKDFLVKLSLHNTITKYEYLVYDRNLTCSSISIYEANVTLEENAFSDNQKELNKNDTMPIKILDLNKDGKNELIFLSTLSNNYYNSGVKLYINDTNSTQIYDVVDKGYDKSFYFFDNNNDGLKDLFIPKYWESELYIQNANNLFNVQNNWVEVSSGTATTNYRTFFPDFNSDGKDDRISLFGCNLKILTNIFNDNNITLIPLEGCSNFTGDEYYHEGISLKLGDFNNDNIDDFLIIYKDNRDPIHHGNDSYFIVLNNGDGTVTERSTVEIDMNMSLSDPFAIGAKTVVGDINQDGYDDFIINGQLFINNKNNSFSKKASLFTNDSFGGEHYIKMKDINLDGIKDILFSGYLGIRAILIFSDYSSKDILLFNDGDKRDIRNLAIGNLDNNSLFDIVRNHNNKIEFIHFK